MCGADLGDGSLRKHVLFTYMDEAGEFSKVHDSLLPLTDDLGDPDVDHPAEVLTSRNDDASVVCSYFTANVTGAGWAVCLRFSERKAARP